MFKHPAHCTSLSLLALAPAVAPRSESRPFGAGEFEPGGFENVLKAGYVHGLVDTKERRILQMKLRDRLKFLAMTVPDSPRSMASKIAFLSSGDTGGRNAGSLSSRRSRTTV